MKLQKSKILFSVLLCLFSLTLLFATSNSSVAESRKFWGSSTTCGPCSSYNGQPGEQGVQNCKKTYYVFFMEVSETIITQNCTA